MRSHHKTAAGSFFDWESGTIKSLVIDGIGVKDCSNSSAVPVELLLCKRKQPVLNFFARLGESERPSSRGPYRSPAQASSLLLFKLPHCQCREAAAEPTSSLPIVHQRWLK